jgi:hypothetical protein
MARFSEYVDSNYLPGEIRSAGLSDYRLSPQAKTGVHGGKKLFKFQPDQKKTGDLFQRFLALQKDPEVLFKASAPMPKTPFGNLASYMG